MIRHGTITVTILSFIVGFMSSSTWAQEPVNTNAPSAPPGKIYAWTYRDFNGNSTRALAFYVRKNASDPSVLEGSICMYQYSSTGTPRFVRSPIQINGVLNKEILSCKLTEVIRGYKIEVTDSALGPAPVVIGWMSVRDNGLRWNVRWKSDTVSFAGNSRITPCDAPPTDDIGEEELISVDATGIGPGATLTKDPGPRPSPTPNPTP